MPPADHSAFGEFVLAHRQQQVRHRDGRVLKLTPRALDALRLFVERPGELLDKPTLMLAASSSIWPTIS